MVRKSTSLCAICKKVESKYKCPLCPTPYCSVPCFKLHKSESCISSDTFQANPDSQDQACPPNAQPDEHERDDLTEPKLPLKPLSALSWPPEPDSSIFTDPLKRDDPKPLKREELMRIATSPQLRHLLSTTSLPKILIILDNLPTPHQRQTALSKLLSLDNESLSKPLGSESLLSGRDSPPPLGDLLASFSGGGQAVDRGTGEGWWLGKAHGKEGMWIGEEEKRVMRVWAGVVGVAIDPSEGSEDLAWEV